MRILDFSQALAGPYATMVLADLGADVIKVELPGRGDDTRHWGPPFIDKESAYFLSVNRNKRSVALDLKSKGGLHAALDLAARCDVVVENFRPGTAARIGIGPSDLRARRKDLIYCSISGFGQDGPPRAGYDQIVQGTAGLMSITGMPDGAPIKVGVPISDITAGMFAAHAILAALFEREQSGRGREIDVAMQDSVIALLTFQAGRYFATGRPPGREGNHHPTIAPYGTFVTVDGYINVSVGNDNQWRRFCEAVGAPELVNETRFATNQERLAARAELHEAIEPLLAKRATAEWVERLEAAGVPAGPIRDLDQVFSDPLVERRGMRVEVDHPSLGPLLITGPPWKVDGHDLPIRRPPPLLGEHTRAVLGEVAGYADSEIDMLTANREIALGEVAASGVQR